MLKWYIVALVPICLLAVDITGAIGLIQNRPEEAWRYWEVVDSIPHPGTQTRMGVFADGDVMWCLENVAGAPFNVYLIDKSNGSLIKQFSYSSFAYVMDINRIGPNLWISSFYPTPERVIVLDATGSYVKEIYPSIGGRIRGMDWVGDTIFYYVNNVDPNN
ncbi:MAG TPA: hypothetical protein EYP24_04070, partial [bacterium (Candidatus Stahlbacteria)]|nr:hypothetical protein [Candidatus Stahlbacteria bacterium]